MSRGDVYGRSLARLYDLFYGAKPYRAESRFLSEILRENGVVQGERLLELACGTGGHALELAKAGFLVTGVDRSAAMLGEARRKAAERGVSVDFLRQDLGDLDSLGYLLTDRAIKNALMRVHRSLRPHGILVVEVWHGEAMVRGYDPVRVRRFRSDGREVLRISETTLYHRTEVAEVEYTVFEQASEGRWRRFRETHRNRFFFRTSFQRLLEKSGFSVLRWYPGLLVGTVGRSTWHLVAVCRAIERGR
jgi:SAM-dependent methyltransferase